MLKKSRFSANCPSRLLFADIADKWSMMILCVLDDEPRRFNDIKRRLEGVSQKSLTQALRKLERNGLVLRRVRNSSPIAVEYQLTELGRSLMKPLSALYQWTSCNMDAVSAARLAFDAERA
ncbi:winged helix-turn-helix transcriptional regulator [Cohaesibacter haloalkalitolerans]|uniref:winged helix-turn-helix transcriptional regulator n=1 Tax=Cohaesibacter haloalkalitolerans TaxID=1162980 RepID=UPI000E64FC0F|nr:helix-turn-helix domain-containing protein [Cohaesibacter haloalkalitolerans]